MKLNNKKFRLIHAITIPFFYAPVHMSFIILFRLFSACIPAINIIVTAQFINVAISIVKEENPFSTIILPLIFVVLIIGYTILSGNILQFINVKAKIKLRERLRDIFVTKRAKLAYQHIENQDSWDLITRVATNPEDKMFNVFNDMTGLISMIISTISVVIILMTQIWWAGIVIILLSIPLMFISVKGGQKSYEANREVTKIQRKYGYLSSILSDREHSLERTMFGYSNKINDTYVDKYEKARKIEYKVQKRWFIRSKAGGVIAALISIVILLILINPVLSKEITIGMFISLVNALFSMVNSMTWQLSFQMEQLAKNNEYMKDLTNFFALSEDNNGESLPVKDVPKFEQLEFKNVYFKYPQTDNYILKGVSFTIEKDNHYSFVGINGAGKTTITKLMTGLYSDYEGEILLNGKELRKYSIAELKRFFCGVFQDFAKYFISIRENIAVGDAYGVNDNYIQDAVDLVGLTDVVSNLENGLDTQLGKIKEGGVDLSGGEWQRIAMARGIVNEADVKILDEPTAALDPIAESQMYEKFQDISKGATTIFISHRLGSTTLSDIIYVLSEGKIVEKGSHKDLMSAKGIYAEMFDSQRSWYENEK